MLAARAPVWQARKAAYQNANVARRSLQGCRSRRGPLSVKASWLARPALNKAAPYVTSLHSNSSGVRLNADRSAFRNETNLNAALTYSLAAWLAAITRAMMSRIAQVCSAAF